MIVIEDKYKSLETFPDTKAAQCYECLVKVLLTPKDVTFDGIKRERCYDHAGPPRGEYTWECPRCKKSRNIYLYLQKTSNHTAWEKTLYFFMIFVIVVFALSFFI